MEKVAEYLRNRITNKMTLKDTIVKKIIIELETFGLE